MSSTTLRSLIAPAAVAALLLSLLGPMTAEADAAAVAGAPASRQKDLVALEGATVPALAATSAGTLSAVIQDAGESLFAADSTLLTVPGLDAVAATISAADLSVPEGYTAVGDVTFSVASATGPADGGFTVTVTDTDEQGATLLSSTDGGPTQTGVPLGSAVPVDWRFDAVGRYTLTLEASVMVADGSGVESTLTTEATEFVFTVGGFSQATSTTLVSSATNVSAGSTATLTATVTPATAEGAVEFFDGTELLGYATLATSESGAVATFETAALDGGEHVFTASFVPTWSTDDDASTSEAVTVTALLSSPEATDPSAQTSSPEEAATVEGQTEDSDAVAEPTVLSVGNVALNLLLSASETATAGTFDTATGGLLDKTSETGAYADQVWHAATDTVIHVGDTEYDADSGTWSTTHAVDDAVAYTNGDNARLLLGLDQASAVGGVNRTYNSDVVSLGGHATLTGVTGATGRVTVTGAIDPNDSDPGVIWDSTTLGQPGSQTTVTYGKGAKSWYQGWTFTEAGRYCITLELSVDSKTNGTIPAPTTYTFYVGDLPDTPTNCAQESGNGGGDDPDLGDEVTIIDRAHTDVRVSLSDGGLALAMGQGDGNGLVLHDFADVLIARTPEPTTVPEVTDSQDLTAIGPVGTEYWYFPTSGGAENWVWPGVSTELLSDSDLSSSITLTLTDYTVDGVRQPEDADVVVMGSTTSPTSAAYVYFSSRLGLPQSTELSANMHAHPLWTFTKQGVYCLALTATARLADGHWSSTSGVLTMVVGSVDAATVTPCERQDIGWVAAASKATPDVTQSDVFTATSGDVQLGLFASEGTLDLRALTSSDGGVTTSTHDAADVIIDSGFATSAGLWRVPGWATTALDTSHYPGLFIDASGVLASQLTTDSGITMTLGDVQGPGDLTLTSTRYSTRIPILESAAGGSTSHMFASMARLTSLWWDFTEPGVYCVPLTWTASLATGVQGSTSTMLTFVVGSDDPASDDYVDRTGLTTCARGQQATAPGGGADEGGEDEGGEDVWDVENGTVNDAGATILNDGHVDIASLVEGGTLVTRVKDTTQSSEATWREPAQTVLQLLPGSQTTVPSGDQWSFLGASGAPLYQVSQTQQAGLLWPGWSTEAIGPSVTQGGVDWALTGVSGPGEFALYETGSFGEPSVLFSTRDGITDDDRTTIPKATHAHGSWAFSAEGNYCLAFDRSTTLADGQVVSDSFVLSVAVGRADVTEVDPDECFQASDDEPTTPDDIPIADDRLTDDSRGEVEVTGGSSTLTAGQLVSIEVGAAHASEWVSVWLHSDPAWLGWVEADAQGVVQVRLPADAEAGAHRIVVKSATGELVGWDALTIVAAATSPDSGDGQPATDAPAAEQVPATQCVAGATILSSGHVDYASRIVGGELESLIGDDTSGSKVYREPAGTVLWLKPSSRVTLPAGYAQVGSAGTQVWQVPQTQNANLIWLGWNTESLNAGSTLGPVSWTIDGISGPGSVKVYLTGSFGGVQSMVFDDGGGYSIPLGVHAHANWAFSAEGVYRITSTQTATLANGQVSSDTETLTIVVGDVDPRSAAGAGTGCGTISNALLLTDDADAARIAADQAAADAADAADAVSPGRSGDAGETVADPFTALSAGNPVPLLLSILGLLLLAGAAGAGILWRRRRTRTAHGDPA